jgi:tRNA(fMet)-specific endonuclease VapC
LAILVADTDALIDFLRGQGLSLKVRNTLSNGTLYTTAISAFELWTGAKSKKLLEATKKLLNAIEVLPIDAATAELAGEIFRNLEIAGQRIGMADCLIAASCITRDLPLLTRNIKHFERLKGLEILV